MQKALFGCIVYELKKFQRFTLTYEKKGSRLELLVQKVTKISASKMYSHY